MGWMTLYPHRSDHLLYFSPNMYASCTSGLHKGGGGGGWGGAFATLADLPP